MNDLWTQLAPHLTLERGLTVVRSVVLVVAGFAVAKLAGRVGVRLAGNRLEVQQATLLRRGVFYAVLSLFLVAAVHELGFNLGVVLGAAGILSVAIGFASQTSASNLISGLFLIGERPFGVGDVIEVAGTTGEVLSIDLLSVKLQTFDNLFVRIPNETLIKTEVRTLTKFPIRRVDLQIGVAYGEDVERVREVLLEVAGQNPHCLDEPKPAFFFLGFGESAIELQFSPWTTRENFIEFKTTIQLEIKRRFDAEGIEIPFPQRVLSAGGPSDPFPVRFEGDGGTTPE